MNETEEKPSLAPPVVRCAYKEMALVETLIAHPQNPNSHPPKQIEMFIAILQFSGVRRAVTVSTRSGYVTRGHGQILAYKEAGWSHIPVDYQDYDSEEAELADLVADNELAKLAEMNTGKLQEIGAQLNSGAFNMQLLGLEEKKLESLMSVAEPPSLSTPAGAPQGDDPPDLQDGSGETTVPSHIRMVQLFFNEEQQKEFIHIVEHFQKSSNIDNITDCVLEILREAYRSSSELVDGEESPGEADPSSQPESPSPAQ